MVSTRSTFMGKQSDLNSFTALKRLVPRVIKDDIKRRLQEHRLASAIQRIRRLPVGASPSADLLERLETGWSNEGMAAQLRFLEEVAGHALATPGPILECGSGLTTLILALVAGRRGVDIWTLEHFPDWHARVSKTLARYNLPHVNNVLAPLKDYGDFCWYDLPLDQMPKQFALIVCDGPPGTTNGGRVGLVPVLKTRLAPGTVILFDDAHREEEARAMSAWAEVIRFNSVLYDQMRGQFAVLEILKTID
jgi:predicted O-methyltransferase YrrM